MLSQKPPKVIFEVPLFEVPGSVLDISAVTPCRLCFIDCRAFVDNHMLQIVEIVDLRGEAFSAISYFWKGNTPPSPDGKSAQAAGDAGFFAVESLVRLASQSCMSLTVSMRTPSVETQDMVDMEIMQILLTFFHISKFRQSKGAILLPIT